MWNDTRWKTLIQIPIPEAKWVIPIPIPIPLHFDFLDYDSVSTKKRCDSGIKSCITVLYTLWTSDGLHRVSLLGFVPE